MREAFQVHQLSPNVNPLDTTKRQVTCSTGQLSDCCLRSSYDSPQIPEHRSPTKYARVSSCSHGDVVMLFCSSFTQSERFLQTDQLITRLQVVVMTSFIRMLMRNVFVNVFKSDAVIWWAAIFRRRRASFVPGHFWNVPGSFRGHSAVFLPKNFPWHLVTRIQFLMEAAACWPILAVVGLSFLFSGPKQDEEVCGCSARLETL